METKKVIVMYLYNILDTFVLILKTCLFKKISCIYLENSRICCGLQLLGAYTEGTSYKLSAHTLLRSCGKCIALSGLQVVHYDKHQSENKSQIT